MRARFFGAAAAICVACAAEGDAWFPFVISYGGEANASSVAHLLDAPAGKHGFVRVVGGEFVTDAGPIRFNGTNLTGPANFPEHHVADRLAGEGDCAEGGWCRPRACPPFAYPPYALVRGRHQTVAKPKETLTAHRANIA